MADRSNQKPDAAQGEDTLRKRGRRRLVGAIALVLLAVIVLPMVFDPEPRPSAPLVSVRIPSEDNTKFTPKPVPKPAAVQGGAGEAKAPQKAPEPPPAAKEETPAPAPRTAAPASTAEAPRPADKPVAGRPEKPAAPASARTATGDQFLVQVGAFASADKVREVTDKLKEARLVHYTEPVATAGGQVVRVRLGPFASRDAADKAREQARALGFPANIVAK